MRRAIQITFLTLFILSACEEGHQPVQPQSLVQISTINALMTGVYDGETTLQELSGRGDFGIGTFNALDGEMVLHNGAFYQIKSDGSINKPHEQTMTPFATVTFFEPEISFDLSASSYPELKSTLDNLLQSPNLFYAIRIDCTMNYIKTRSVPAQSKPYPPLVEITATQPEFEASHISGTLLGFYCPSFVSGVNVPGYHLHFLSDNEAFGGHVLEFDMEKGVLSLDQIADFRVSLPEDGDFLINNVSEDMSEDLSAMEGK